MTGDYSVRYYPVTARRMLYTVREMFAGSWGDCAMDDKELAQNRQRAQMRNLENVPGTNERNKYYVPPPAPSNPISTPNYFSPSPPPSSAQSSTATSKQQTKTVGSSSASGETNGLDTLIALAGAGLGIMVVIKSADTLGWNLLIGAGVGGGIAYALRNLIKILLVIAILCGILWLVFAKKPSTPVASSASLLSPTPASSIATMPAVIDPPPLTNTSGLLFQPGDVDFPNIRADPDAYFRLPAPPASPIKTVVYSRQTRRLAVYLTDGSVWDLGVPVPVAVASKFEADDDVLIGYGSGKNLTGERVPLSQF